MNQEPPANRTSTTAQKVPGSNPAGGRPGKAVWRILQVKAMARRTQRWSCVLFWVMVCCVTSQLAHQLPVHSPCFTVQGTAQFQHLGQEWNGPEKSRLTSRDSGIMPGQRWWPPTGSHLKQEEINKNRAGGCWEQTRIFREGTSWLPLWGKCSTVLKVTPESQSSRTETPRKR